MYRILKIYSNAHHRLGHHPFYPSTCQPVRVGIMLCEYKDQSFVHYSVLNDNEQLFASRYRLVLPTEDELRREL
jgi:hypothetical protein